MNKSDIIETFRERVTKQNPWQPYTGPAGGQGWVNVITGEKRYQENRPDPGEGMPEDYEGDVPQPDVDVEGFDPSEVTAEDYQEFLEEGMKVEGVDPIDGSWVGGEIQAVGSESVIVVDEVSDVPEEILYEDLTDHPVELEPWDGYGDGWMEAPDDLTELSRGQTIELYNLETGEYLEGEVEFVGDDGEAMDVSIEGKETPIPVGEADYAHDLMVTAAEDPAFVEGIPEGFDEIDPGDLDEALEPGDEVAIQMDTHWAPDEAMSGIVMEDGKINVGEWDDIDRYIDPTSDDHLYNIEGAWFDAPEQLLPEEIPGVEIDPTILTGSLVTMEHPTFGEVAGEVTYSEDPHGWGWLTVQTVPEMEEGMEFSVGQKEWEIIGFDEEMGTTHVQLRDEAGDEVEWLAEDVEDQLDPVEVSLTTNPESPLYYEDHLAGAESPWEEAYDHSADYTPGDQILVDGMPATVNEVGNGFVNAVMPESHEYPDENFYVDEIEGVDPVEIPDAPSGFNAWEDPPDVTEMYPEDSVVFYDNEGGEVLSGNIGDDIHDGEMALVLGEDGQVHYVYPEDLIGHARTGKEPLPEGDTLDWAETGEYVEVAYRDPHETEVRTARGYVVNYDDYSGDVTLVDPEEGSVRVSGGAQEDAVVTDRPEPPEAETDLDPQAAADQLADRVGVGGMIDREYLLSELMQVAPPGGVVELTHALGGGSGDCWKNNSGSSLAARWDKALASATGAPNETLQGESPSYEAKQAAEVIHELSKRRWEENTPHEVYRGLSHQDAKGLLGEYLNDPFNTEEYEIPMLATTNFTEERSKAEGLGKTPMTVRRDGHEIPSDWVAAYHDDFFEGPNDNENEISMVGGKFKAPRDGIYLNKDTDINLGDAPHEWDEHVAEAVYDKLRSVGSSPLVDNNPYGQPTMNQLENVARIEQALDRHGYNTNGLDIFEFAREELDITDAYEVDYPELGESYTDEDLSADWSPVHDDYDLQDAQPGDWVKIEEGVHGEEGLARVKTVDAGEVIIEEDTWTGPGTPDPYYYSDEIGAVSPTGGGAEYIGNVEPDSVDEGDYLYYQTLDGDVQQGTVFDVETDDVGDPIEVNIGEPGDTQWRSIEDLGQAPEGPTGGPVDDPEDLNPGDVIEYETDVGGVQTGTVEEVNDSGSVSLEGGTSIMPWIAEEATVTEPSGGSDEDDPDVIDDETDVDPGDQVLVPHYDDTGPWEIESLIEDPDHGYTGVQLENGDALDFGEIMPPDEDESSLEDEAQELVDEIEEDEGGSDWSTVNAEHLDMAEPGLHEEFGLTGIPGEDDAVDVSVVETPWDDGDPYEVREADYENEPRRWLIWPDGEVEAV